MYNKIIILFPFSLCSVFSVEVKTSSGTVRGHTVEFANKEINEFLNIPYAEPPLGSLRFAKPVPLKEPRSIIDGTKSGHSCYQYGHTPNVPVSEDCLILNIWSSVNHNSSALKAVMLWIHGGGFAGGSSVGSHKGTYLASHDVVVVTINYRLGPFGFLYAGEKSAPGNVALFDMNMALKWVKQNIHLFGGNPNNITIFGESAGSQAVSALIVSPVSKGMFNRAILQSGAVLHNQTAQRLSKETALKQAKEYAKHFDCTDSQWLECLRKISAKKLNDFVYINPYAIHETEFLPLAAQKAFQAHNFSTDVDIIAGVMSREGSGFGPHIQFKSVEQFKETVKKINVIPELNYDKIIEFYLKDINTSDSSALLKALFDIKGDIVITCSTYQFAKKFAEASPKSNVFFFEFTYPSKGPIDGVPHGSDVSYVFGDPVYHKANDSQFSEDLMKMWTNFAKNSKPLEGFPSNYNWPRFINAESTSGDTKTKEMNPEKPNHIIDNLSSKVCDGFWREYYA